jgi:hypothetical protein
VLIALDHWLGRLRTRTSIGSLTQASVVLR